MIVPTLGRSPWLGPCLAALRREAEVQRIVVVAQGEPLPAELSAFADELLELRSPLGFARAANLGISRSNTELVALVNDDALIEPGWTSLLAQAFAGDGDLGAAQGVNLMLERPVVVDGCGIGWNRALEAVQLGRGGEVPALSAPVREIFGASATAVLYRRAALEAVRLADGTYFDPNFGSYYEDVDLACRLKAAGFRAQLVPAARARHGGSVTGRTLGWRMFAQITRNHLLTLARTLGREFLPALPRLAWTDAKALLRSLLRGHLGAAAGISAGWFGALARLPRFASGGPATLRRATLARWDAGGAR